MRNIWIDLATKGLASLLALAYIAIAPVWMIDRVWHWLMAPEGEFVLGPLSIYGSLLLVNYCVAMYCGWRSEKKVDMAVVGFIAPLFHIMLALIAKVVFA